VGICTWSLDGWGHDHSILLLVDSMVGGRFGHRQAEERSRSPGWRQRGEQGKTEGIGWDCSKQAMHMGCEEAEIGPRGD
jgi:hypothetical protein